MNIAVAIIFGLKRALEYIKTHHFEGEYAEILTPPPSSWRLHSTRPRPDRISAYGPNWLIKARTYKKAVLSQMRDARYISRSWAVAEIWPFEINQNGGGRHLEFARIENSAIRSAVPKNPTP